MNNKTMLYRSSQDRPVLCRLHASVLVLLLGVSMLLCSCVSQDSAKTPPEASVSVTDMTGRSVTLEAPASRIVALTPADCEIIYALGAGDKLIGRGEYCDYPEEVLKVTSVQSGYETNVEQIIALRPDAVFMADMDRLPETTDMLEAAGIPVIVSDADNIEGVYRAISMIGTALGKDKEAGSLVAQMKDIFDSVRTEAAVSTDDTKTVYFEVSPLEYGLWTAGSNTFMNEAAGMAGLKNCFEDLDGWAAVSEEQVIDRKPDYIVTITMYSGTGPTPEEEILSRKGWEDIPAVRNGAILNLSGNELSRPGPRLADGTEMLRELVRTH